MRRGILRKQRCRTVVIKHIDICGVTRLNPPQLDGEILLQEFVAPSQGVKIVGRPPRHGAYNVCLAVFIPSLGQSVFGRPFDIVRFVSRVNAGFLHRSGRGEVVMSQEVEGILAKLGMISPDLFAAFCYLYADNMVQ